MTTNNIITSITMLLLLLLLLLVLLLLPRLLHVLYNMQLWVVRLNLLNVLLRLDLAVRCVCCLLLL